VSPELLDAGASGEYKWREAWVNNFSFLAHASFYVPRWAFDLALNIKPSGIPVWRTLQVAPLENLSSFRVDSYPIWSYM